MRLLSIFVIICVFGCLNGDQRELNTGNTGVGGTFKRLFGNWFNGKKVNDQISNKDDNLPDPLKKEDFDSQLPKQSTDKMINDAISERIIEESREQHIDNPFIEQPSITEKSPNNREGKQMANTATDTIPIAEALRIVNSSNLSDCVARVICELSCNANRYGNQGRIVFRNLIKLQFDQNIKSDDAKFFRQAAAKGRQIIQGKKDCKECFSIYSNCRSSSKDLVAVSSMFKL